MYDRMLAYKIGRGITKPKQVGVSEIIIDADIIYSRKYVNKYYMIYKYPDTMERGVLSLFKGCCKGDTQIDYTILCEPKPIDWGSAEMRSRMRAWSEFSDEVGGEVDIFKFSEEFEQVQQRNRLINSTKFFNIMDLKYRRALLHSVILLRVYCKNNYASVENFSETCEEIEKLAKALSIKTVMRSYTLMEELQSIIPFSRDTSLTPRIPRRMMTDDMVVNLTEISQGITGEKGAVLGLDVLNGTVVFRQFKSDPDKAENWLISAETGGGKSYWVKNLIMFLMALNFKICIMDYEGDEYTNIANFIAGGNPDDVIVIQLGGGSGIYFDPCCIADKTGVDEIDKGAKANAQDFITAMFTIMVGGEKEFTKEVGKILSLAVQRMYDSYGVTEDSTTWSLSKDSSIYDIYDEICSIVRSGEFNNETDREKHLAAVKLKDAVSVYLEEGEAKYGTFTKPMRASDLHKSNLMIFSFGMKGADTSSTGADIIALKQLSVAYVNILVSNYCKFVQHRFNVKVWEEFQRWGSIEGSASIIGNCITGGRKRGDVHLIITNDLVSMLDDNNEMNARIRQNVRNYAIGKLDTSVRRRFVEKFDLWNLLPELDLIGEGKNGYDHAFCVYTDDNNAVVTKVMLPSSVAKSGLYNTGISQFEK